MIHQAIIENMIEIRSSSKSNEIDLSGSPKDLREVQQSILNLLQGENQQTCIIQSKVVDPSPYDVCLSSLSISKTDASIKISTSGDSLKIEGDIERLKMLSSWFKFNDDTLSGYHIHCDYIGCESGLM